MSDRPREPLQLYEYEKLPYDKLSGEEISQLEKATAEVGLPVFRFFRKHVQARQYVGMVKTGDRIVQILPKIHNRVDENLGFLVFMLSYTRRLGLQPMGMADYEKLHGSFLEIWIQHFAAELNRLLRKHLMHRYMEIEERTAFLRGKLLVEHELGGASALYARYACRYEVFTSDHLINQTLKFCNSILLAQTQVQSNRIRLQENDAFLADVTYRRICSEDLKRIHFDRLNRHYEPILDLCRLLLESSTLDFKSGRITQLAFIFDMNKLFEQFVVAFLKRNRSRIKLGGDRGLEKVVYHHRLGKLFGEFNMEADIVLTDTTGQSFLVDTKYKILDPSERHGRLSQGDFYQMYAYGSAGKQPYNDIVLLYPTTGTVQHTFHQNKTLRLHVRQFDPRKIYDLENRCLNESEVVDELSRVLSCVWITDRA